MIFGEQPCRRLSITTPCTSQPVATLERFFIIRFLVLAHSHYEGSALGNSKRRSTNKTDEGRSPSGLWVRRPCLLRGTVLPTLPPAARDHCLRIVLFQMGTSRPLQAESH